MKTITICADDYGQNSAISSGIIKLIELGHISATSCLVKSKDFAEYATWLKPFIGKIDIGLHFDLTSRGSSLGNLILQSQAHLLNKQMIFNELQQQLDLFIQYFGIKPNYIDGHQHVHQFPQISDIVISLWQNQLNQQTYIRYVCPNFKNPYFAKQISIFLSTDLAFGHKLKKYQIPHNQSFAGIYDFSPNINYKVLFKKFLTNTDNHGLIMCHPAMEITVGDPITKARVNEFIYLQSNEFTKFRDELINRAILLG